MRGDSLTFSYEDRPVVALFAETDVLSISLLEQLLANFCRVTVVAENLDLWRESTKHLKDNEFIEIIKIDDLSRLQRADYVIYESLCLNASKKTLSQEKKKIDKAVGLAKREDLKALFVLPYAVENECVKNLSGLIKDYLKEKDTNLGAVYVGDVIGPRMELSEERLVSKVLKEALSEPVVGLPKEETVFHPILSSDQARYLVNVLFSFGISGQSLAALPKGISPRQAFNTLKKTIGNLTFAEDASLKREFVDVGKKETIKTSSRKAIGETLTWFVKEKKLPPPSVKRIKPEKKEKKEIKPRGKKPQVKVESAKLARFVWPAFIVFFASVFIPFFLLLVSAASLVFAKNQALEGNFSTAQNFLLVSSKTASVVRGETLLLSKTPLLGGVFLQGTRFAQLIQKTAGITERGVQVASVSTDFLKKALGDTPYEPANYAKTISLELDSLYQDMGFLESEIAESTGISERLFSSLIDKVDLPDLRDKLLLAKKLSNELPSLLGDEGKKVYLVLFQNNMELRPTGGFIGSFALVTFDAGRLIDINVQDVYSADGQLKGHVEPPVPIKDYLGEANWYLRDSNWDPDFPTSAQRAEWFLDKEIDVSVDGVLAIDLEVAKEILKVTGPLYIADFGQEIDYKNLYEKTQYEAEKGFFPGSQRKRNFLTALTRTLLIESTSLGEEDYMGIARGIIKSLSEKHILIFFHNINAQKVVSQLAWTGAVSEPFCEGNCYTDWLGVVEANVGVNKANHFIKRAFSLSVDVNESGLVERALTILLKDNASPALGLSGRYKVYVRVLVPEEAEFQQVRVISAGVSEFIEPEITQVRGRKEAGVLVELSPGQTKSLSFSWQTTADIDFSSPGEYRFYWRKQPGTVADKAAARFNFPDIILPASLPEFSLTDEEGFLYNLDLARDFSSRIFW